MADPLNGIFMNDSNSLHPSCSINSLHNKNKQKSNLNNSSSDTPIASLSLFPQSFMFYRSISHAQMGVRLAKCDWDRNTLGFTMGAPAFRKPSETARRYCGQPLSKFKDTFSDKIPSPRFTTQRPNRASPRPRHAQEGWQHTRAYAEVPHIHTGTST